MLKILRKTFLGFLRRLLGVEQVLRQLQQLNDQQVFFNNALGNRFFSMGSETFKDTAVYQRCAGIISLLSPMDIHGAAYVRVGRRYDGGYVMLDDFKTGAHVPRGSREEAERKPRGSVQVAYSFGICDDVSWEKDMASRGFDVFLYDHTIRKLPEQHHKFHYFRMGVSGFRKGPDLKTLAEFINSNHHTDCKNLILKMDIEGNEWDVFSEVTPEIISQFSQIVLELHDLTQNLWATDHIILDVLKKIHRTHQSVHVHANNSSYPLWIGDLVLPSVLEVTYVRRSDYKDQFIPNTRRFPTEMDQPNCVRFPDIYLGRFSS